MASKGVQELRAEILEYIGSGDTIEAEQVMDMMFSSLLGDGMPKSKEGAIDTVLTEVGEDYKGQIEKWVADMINRYDSDQLPEFTLKHNGEGIPTESQLQAIFDAMPQTITDCDDSYLYALYNHKMDKPKPGPIHTGEDLEMILTSFLAGVDNGANYLTLYHPPQEFLDKVLCCDGVTRDSFSTTVRKFMDTDRPFLLCCKASASRHQDDYKRMCEDYQNMLRQVPENVQEGEYKEVRQEKKLKAPAAATAVMGGLVGLVTKIFGNIGSHKKAVTDVADKWVATSKNMKLKVGTRMVWLWRLVTGVNVTAFLIKTGLTITSFFVDVTGPKTEKVAGFVSKIPILGGIAKSMANGVSSSAIRTKLVLSSIPWVIALAVLAAYSMRVLHKKESGEDNVFNMLISMLVLAATTISVIIIIRCGFALYKSFMDSEYFWATFYENF